MGVLATHNRQLIFIYSDTTILAKSLIGYMRSSTKKIRLININTEIIVGTIWIEIAEMLGEDLKNIVTLSGIKPSHKSRNYSTNDIIKLLHNQPEVLKHPILINGKNAKIIYQIPDVFKMLNTKPQYKHN